VRLSEILQESFVVADIQGVTKEGILRELVEPLRRAKLIRDADSVVEIIMDREKLGSTGIGDGVAIPHGKMPDIDTVLCVVGRSRDGVDFDAVDHKPVHIFFLVLAPEGSAGLHLTALSRISKILRDQTFRKKVLDAAGAHDIYLNIIEEDEQLS
jgi:nitrogen PTS system EIIA component